MPKVSVIIPAYNAMKFLPETLENVLGQTYKDFEIIIVNDSSSDGIERWAAQIKDPRVKLISQENRGTAGARNTGINSATGEYIAFLDADDLWEPTKLKKQVCALQENPKLGLVYTWVDRVDEKGKSIGKPFKSFLEGNVWEKLIENNTVAPSSAMLRRSCFENAGTFDESLNPVEDWDMWLRIASHYPFKVIKEPLLYYRENSTSISKNWQLGERSCRILIEKAFASAPPELLHLKSRSYSFAYFHIASQLLQSRNPDCKVAISFIRQALAHNPQLFFSRECLRISLAICFTQCFGANYYRKSKAKFRALRQYLVSVR